MATSHKVFSDLSINPPLPKFGAVIFDMDGLAIDTEPSFIIAWKQAAIEFGVYLDDEMVRSWLGLHADDVEMALNKIIGAGFDSTRFQLLAAKHWREHVETHGIPPLPGLHELLKVLISNNIPYALATNSDGRNASECLRLSGLVSHFPLVVTCNQVPAGKPAPDLFLYAANCMGVAASDCMVLEDSVIGLLAASRAGMTPVLVKAKTSPLGSHQLAAIYFRSLQEVADAISLSF